MQVLLEGKGAEIAGLEEKVARLERLISRDSGNSSVPFSPDDLPGKKPPERKARSGAGDEAQAGTAAGTPGAYLAWNPRPGKAVDVFPGGGASAGATWPARGISGWRTFTRSPPCPAPGRRLPSMTGTRWDAPAAGCTWRARRRRRPGRRARSATG
ncbi:MAG TPA: DUF6444 domain-containing protein [Streptosporangiaceae bacterium]|nr:DUF6444 domain-containing protein [Streptosporangiaceae bacterium]